MTKEKFTYELIDQWLYLLNQQCILMENYKQTDRTQVYRHAGHVLRRCFDYYDQLYEAHIGCSEEEIDFRLEILIQKLRNKTINNIVHYIETRLCTAVPDKKVFMDEFLFHDSKGNAKDITIDSLIYFVDNLRRTEECKNMGKAYE